MRDAILIRHHLLGQSRFTRILHDRLFRHSTFDGFTAITRSDLEKRFREFADQCTEGIVHYTSASSAVVRLYDPFSKVLSPVSISQSEQGAYDSGTPRPMKATNMTSVNGYCFSFCDADRYVYLPNVNVIPEEYQGRGLRGVSRRRSNTSSEICFPIDRHGLRLGTLNVESPAFSAFDADILFLADIVKCLADYYGRIRSLNDREWLSRLANRQMWVHRLKNFRHELKDARILTMFDSITQAILSAPVPMEAPSEGNNQSVGALVSDLCYTMKDNPDWKGKISVSKDVSCIELPQYIFDPLRSICLGFLENSTKHKSTKDRLELSVTPSHSADISELLLKYSSNGTVEKETLDYLGVSPFRRSGQDDVHFGLFSVGVHVRLLGGVVEFPAVPSRRSYIEMRALVRVPVSNMRGRQTIAEIEND